MVGLEFQILKKIFNKNLQHTPAAIGASLPSLGFVLILFSLAVFFLPKLQTSYSVRDFLPKESTVLKSEGAINGKYQLFEKSPIVVLLSLPENSTYNWTNANAFANLKFLTDEVRNFPKVNSVTSLTSLKLPLNLEKELKILSLSEVEDTALRGSLLSNPMIVPQILAKDFRTTAVLIDTEPMKVRELTTFLKNLEDHVRSRLSFAQIEIGGAPAVQTQLNRSLRQELAIMAFLSFVLFGGAIFVFFRSVTMAAFVGGLIIAANIFCFGLLSFLRIPISLLLSCLPCLIAITAVSQSIQTFDRWRERNPNQMHPRNRAKRSRELTREMLWPNFLASLCTGVGFLVLTWSGVPAISQFAAATTMSIAVTFLFTQWALSVSLPFISPPRMKPFLSEYRPMAFIFRHARLILAVCTVLFVLSLTQLPSLNFSGRLFSDLPRSNASRIATERADARLGGLINLEYDLTAQVGYWQNSRKLFALRDFCHRLRASPEVKSCLSSYELLKDFPILSSASLSESAFLFSLTSPNLLTSFLLPDFSSARIQIRTADLNSLELKKLKARVESDLRKTFEGTSLAAGGMGYTTHQLTNDLAKSLVLNFWHSLLVIGLFLIFVFRSLRWALVACLPNLVPPVFLIGLLGSLEVAIKPGLALVFSITLGIAFVNTTYLLSKMQRLMKLQGPHRGLIRMTFQSELSPCLSASVLVMMGFTAFFFSSFAVNQQFGLLTIAALTFGLIGDLVLLPAFIKTFPQSLGLKKLPPATAFHRAKTGLHPTPSPAPVHGNVLRLGPPAPPVETVAERRNRWPNKSVDETSTGTRTGFGSDRIASALILFALGLGALLPQWSHAKSSGPPPADAYQILKKTRDLLDTQQERFHLTLSTKEKNGSVINRKLEVSSLRKSETQYLKAKVLEPKDVKGLTFLAHIQKAEDSQWLYLPSSGQVRRISSDGGDGALLGSEVTAEDLNSAALRSSKIKLLKQTPLHATIQIAPERSRSAYSQAVVTIDRKTNLPKEIIYYQQVKAVKTLTFHNFRKWPNGKFRASKIVVTNLLTQRSSTIGLKPLGKAKRALSENQFSVATLANGD